MTLPPITSRDNPRIKAARALHERAGRREQGAYLIEGVTLVLEALAAGLQPLWVLRDETRLSASARAALDVALAPHAAIVQPVGPTAFRAVADAETPQGVAAVLPLPAPAALAIRPGDLGLMVDRVQDPGNLGTMLRSAAAAGARWVVTSAGTVDPFAPKVTRAGMGAHFRLTIAADLTWPTIRAAIDGRARLLGASGDGRTPYDQIDWRAGGALVIGAEAAGLSDAARAAVDDTIAIPLLGGVESLNAAMAATVILFEAARQRRLDRAARTP